MVDTQQDFQTKRLLDMVEDKIPQFLIEFRKLNDVLLDILLLIADNTKEDIEEPNEVEVVETPVNVIDFHRIVEDN